MTMTHNHIKQNLNFDKMEQCWLTLIRFFPYIECVTHVYLVVRSILFGKHIWVKEKYCHIGSDRRKAVGQLRIQWS